MRVEPGYPARQSLACMYNIIRLSLAIDLGCSVLLFRRKLRIMYQLPTEAQDPFKQQLRLIRVTWYVCGRFISIAMNYPCHTARNHTVAWREAGLPSI